MLDGYDNSLTQFLEKGFSKGFPLHYQGAYKSFIGKNLVSALSNRSAVDTKIAKELAASRLAGPFDKPPFQQFWVSPLGVVPKKVPGEFRLIHHLSYPHGASVNDGIHHEHSTVSYSTIDDAIKLIKQLGPGCFMAKTDIKNAFRLLPIRPQDYPLLGMVWKESYYYDRCMPMGCSSSCSTFEKFSTAVQWIAQNKLNIHCMLHLLDDFFLAARSEKLCKDQLDLFLCLCNYLGIPMAPEKTCGPSTNMSFAGIELDTLLSEARLPSEKIEKCKSHILEFIGRKKVTLKEIQSLNGLLNFACSVVRPGRAFLRRLIDLTIGIKSQHHFIRLNKEIKKDLNLWLSFLSNFNGKSFFIDDMWQSSHHLNLFTDAAGALGFGALFGSHWCYGKWPDNWVNTNIAILEFFPIVLSLHLWGADMRNRSILFYTDNEALVHVINKQSCKDKTLMVFVRSLVLLCLQFNIMFKAKHISGVKNNLADALSRLQVQKFRQLAPTSMDQSPTDIPVRLQPENWSLQ